MVDKGEGDSTSRRPQVADQCGHERILGNKGTKIEAVRKGVFGVAPVNVAKSVMKTSGGVDSNGRLGRRPFAPGWHLEIIFPKVIARQDR